MRRHSKRSFNSYSAWFAGIVILLTVFIISVSWNLIHWSNNQTRISKNRNDLSLSLIRKFSNDTAKTFVLTSKDIKDINAHIDALAEKSNLEVEHNVNWINNFLTIGIGLLAIFGGFLPLVVNFFSKEHLKEKIDSIDEKIQTHTGRILKIKKQSQVAEQKASSAEKSMEGFETRFGLLQGNLKEFEDQIEPFENRVQKIESTIQKVPYITSLILHNSISRLLSADNIRYYTEANRHKRLAKILKAIQAALEECSRDDYENLKNDNLEFFKAVITDFKIGFLYSPIKHALSKKLIQAIDQYSLFLDEFSKQDVSKYKELFGQAATKLQDLILLVEEQKIVA